MILFGLVVVLVLVLIVAAIRRGAQGLVTALCVLGIVAILAAMLLPALSRAKSKAQRISAVNNLKQIGLAARTWSIDNGDAMPPSFEAMKNELSTDKITYDPNTGQRFVYVGAGKSAANPEAIIAYSPSDQNGRAVAFADGSVQVMSAEKFQEALAARRRAAARGDSGQRAGGHPGGDWRSGNERGSAPARTRVAAPARPATPQRRPRAGSQRQCPRLTSRCGTWHGSRRAAQSAAAVAPPSPEPRPRACGPSASRCRAPARPSPSPKSSTPARNR